MQNIQFDRLQDNQYINYNNSKFQGQPMFGHFNNNNHNNRNQNREHGSNQNRNSYNNYGSQNNYGKQSNSNNYNRDYAKDDWQNKQAYDDAQQQRDRDQFQRQDKRPYQQSYYQQANYQQQNTPDYHKQQYFRELEDLQYFKDSQVQQDQQQKQQFVNKYYACLEDYEDKTNQQSQIQEQMKSQAQKQYLRKLEIEENYYKYEYKVCPQTQISQLLNGSYKFPEKKQEIVFVNTSINQNTQNEARPITKQINSQFINLIPINDKFTAKKDDAKQQKENEEANQIMMQFYQVPLLNHEVQIESILQSF